MTDQGLQPIHRRYYRHQRIQLESALRMARIFVRTHPHEDYVDLVVEQVDSFGRFHEIEQRTARVAPEGVKTRISDYMSETVE